MKYQVELVWNREFNWCQHGQPFTNLDHAIAMTETLSNMGDGARVKKTRIVDLDGNVVWQYGKKIKPEQAHH